MKKDKLTVRERLIDFCEWCNEHNEYDFIYKSIVDIYIEEKSINQSSSETGTLSANEAKEKEIKIRCDVPNCNLKAKKYSIFCCKHDG